MWKIFHDEYFDDIGPYITEEDKDFIEKDLLFNHFGQMKMLAETHPENMVLNDDYDEELKEHYGDKPYWNDFCRYYNDWKKRVSGS